MTTCMTTKFAGRLSLGSTHPICVTKEGQFHSRSAAGDEAVPVLACGLACSEVVSGKAAHGNGSNGLSHVSSLFVIRVIGRNLAGVLMPGFEYEKHVLQALLNDEPAPPLAVHTSAGVPAALGEFIETLGEYLPWRHQEEEENVKEGKEDWFVSLQIEGASAVLAAIDLMLQLRHFQEEEAGQHRVASLSDWTVGGERDAHFTHGISSLHILPTSYEFTLHHASLRPAFAHHF